MNGFTFEYGKLGETALTNNHNLAIANFGGLSSNEVAYVQLESESSVQTKYYSLKDVPVDYFWSLTVYNNDGTSSDVENISVNDANVTKNEDGSVMLWFSKSCPKRAPKTNVLQVEDGWKGVLPLYSPTEKYRNGNWQAPPLELAH